MKNYIRKIAAAICAAVCAASSLPAVQAAAQEIKYEAESASLSGLSTVSDSSFSGGKYVKMTSSGSCTFNITVAESGLYSFNFVSSGIGGDKVNNALLDGEAIGEFSSKANTLGDAVVSAVYVSEGSHQVTVTPSWGWINLDCLIVSEYTVKDYYSVSNTLINPDASESAQRLMSYLADNYGKNVLSGQQSDGGLNGKEFTAIKNQTGETPAVLGLDLMDYTPSRVEKGASSSAVEKAIEFSNAGGIVTVCWHWNAPDKYLKSGTDSNGNPRWWGGFYTSNVDMDFNSVMNGGDNEGYYRLMSDITAIAEQLQKLKEADVPVLFRPLHEASGGWFWWGSGGAEPYKKLWKIMYEKLTYDYGLDNLIWVWNGQDKDWYPGDEYVDIIGEDIYPGEKVYGSQSSCFDKAANYTDSTKIVTLSENGCLFDVDEAINANTLWSWFCVWSGDFCCSGTSISEKYTEKYMWNKVYSHSNVITLDELPDLKTYPIRGEKKSLDTCGITLSAESYTYNGSAKKPAVTVKDGSTTLVSGRDYTVSYSDNVNAGTAKVVISGKGDYEGSVTKTFVISPRSIGNCEITLGADSVVFRGTRVKPTVTVKMGDTTLTGSDYSLSYTDNLSVGTGKVTITGKGNFKGTAVRTFSITQRSVSNCDIQLAESAYFNGARIKSAVKVFCNGTELYSGNYTVTYANNLSAGTATVTITGKNNLKGTAVRTFKINPRSVGNCEIILTENPDDKTKPIVIVKAGNNVIYSGNYSVTYSAVKSGKVTVTITGKNNLSGTAVKTYTVV